MSIVNIISAIGNNSSIYPLLVRDCGIEIPVKLGLTYNQNINESKGVAKLAVRERFLDEYAVSAVWLGGIPLVDWLSKRLIKQYGCNSDVNIKLLKEEEGVQGLEYNIKKFANSKYAGEAVQDLINVKAKKNFFQRCMAGKFAAAVLIPMTLMGVIIPKIVFASSAKKVEEQRAKEKQAANLMADSSAFKKNVSFGSIAGAITNMNTVQRMILVDSGYAAGRMGTSRNKNELADVTFKMTGMMFLNFALPPLMKKGFDAVTKNSLDVAMLADKKFIEQIKTNTLELPKSVAAKDLFEFVDNNPNSLFVQFADKFKKVKMIKNDIRENLVRDPRAYVDVKELGKFRDAIEQFAKKAGSKDVQRLAKNARALKTLTILTNIGLSSFLLAYCLPKAQFAFRKLVTGSDLEPGIAGEFKKKGVSA